MFSWKCSPPTAPRQISRTIFREREGWVCQTLEKRKEDTCRIRYPRGSLNQLTRQRKPPLSPSSTSRSSGATNPREAIKLTIFFNLPILSHRNFPSFSSDVSPRRGESPPPPLTTIYVGSFESHRKFSHKFIGDWSVTCFDTSRASLEHVATRIRSSTKCYLSSTNHTLNIFDSRPVSFCFSYFFDNSFFERLEKVLSSCHRVSS